MKETLDPVPADRITEQAADQEGFANRKLIRPSLNRNDHPHNNHGHNHAQNHVSNHGGNHGSAERRDRERPGAPAKKVAPIEQTNAENFYYQKQMQTKTPMVVVLRDGEEVHGVIEWYDKACIKLNRNGAPNLMIYKPAIKYMFKEGEAVRR
jgi:host factor-I protein